ncbi:MAG: zf-HC2 domain-containing protein [Ruminococcus sp.]|uniref:zf-HC2 domain-containing protein n=1 Tax=Ruminococcus sp. TaxID=41978 RepID=UPI0025F761D0|nr:zf-HC2 domain-containing protein [Ruminococcus sp.]MCR5600761.1 zf-HC2 domain-containing protein [Ruminococcus sp.]
MKCEIIKDLLPLYCDNALSDVSKEEIEKHIADCEDCQKTYEEMKNGDIKLDTKSKDIKPMTKVKRKIKITKILFAVFVAAFFLLGTAYELFCAHPVLTKSDNISCYPTINHTNDVYHYFDDINVEEKDIEIPIGSKFEIDSYNNAIYLDGERLVDEYGNNLPATGVLYHAGDLRIYINVDNMLSALKYRIDQTYNGNAVSARLEFRPCLPFRQNIDELTNVDGLVWSAPMRDISEGSTLTIHCRDKDIKLDLYKLAQEAE